MYQGGGQSLFGPNSDWSMDDNGILNNSGTTVKIGSPTGGTSAGGYKIGSYTQTGGNLGSSAPSTNTFKGSDTSSGISTAGMIGGVVGGLGSAWKSYDAAQQLPSGAQKSAATGDAVESGISSALGMLGPWGMVAGAALNLVNGVGGSLMNNNATAKAANKFQLNGTVMKSASYGGVTSGAQTAKQDGMAYRKAGLFGKLFTSPSGLQNEFQTSNTQQGLASNVLKANQSRMDAGNASTEMQATNLQNKDYNSQMWNNGSVTFGKEGSKLDPIHIKKSHEGKFTEYKARTGESTEEALHSSNPHVRKMANFARNAAKWKHQHGGKIGVPETTPRLLPGTGPKFGEALQNTVTDTANKPIDKPQQITNSNLAKVNAPVTPTMPALDISSDILDMVNQAIGAPTQATTQVDPAQQGPIDAASLPGMQEGGTMSTSGSTGTLTYGQTKKKLGTPTKSYKGGGAVNVIAEGELHAHKHDLKELPHLEDAPITHKGIPVVSFDDVGEVTQHAEVEAQELILHYDLTKQLEALAKEGTDEAAIKAGKLLAREIVKNTKDKTGVLESIDG